MKKIEISDVQKNEIINDYNNGFSIRKLEKKYPYSFTFLQKLINTIDFDKNILNNYPQRDGYYITAICKITGKEFKDYKNQSGALTNHVQSLYNIVLPSKYKRKSIEFKTGRFWYDSYFTFKYLKLKKEKKCKYCDWVTNDINNLSGAYEKHLKMIHDKCVTDYLNEFPDEKTFFKKEIYRELIKCEVCGESYKYITNTHLKKHGLTQLEYKLKYGSLPISEDTKEKLKINYKLYLKKSPKIKTSTFEDFIINAISVNFKQSDRNVLNGKEIDLLYNNIGFEINGNIFHTEIFGKKIKHYHLNKTLSAKEKGVTLYHIFDDEIIDKPEIIINKLKHILNINTGFETIHARKCQIIDSITTIEKSIFLNDNHIQGNDKSNYSVVAKHNNEIVAIMTFNNKRYMNKNKDHNDNTYELSRFCLKKNVICTGIASRLLKYFIKKHNPQKIITFADIRWTPNSNDNLYTKLGFTLTKTLKPDYWYYNPKVHRVKRFHKFGFGKNNLKKRFPLNYNKNKSEWEIMQEVGYDRIWDCGKFKYELML